ncbi:putative sulfate exporter family transporter [uncultured Ferrimonas sp.]|uniref:YeiH family protein n=1 Tax=uncultured Ferrimonas sp. TaxID=432640 RepID=UPI002608EDEA|nr:putative sulfate exporter family transporter [uncultured Ferrimonas sp.]
MAGKQILLSRVVQRPSDWGFWLVALLCLLPLVNSPMALMFGLVLATVGWVPQGVSVSALAKKLLGWSIIGLGFGIQLEQALQISWDSLGLILTTIFGTLAVGLLLARLLKVERTTGHLIASGTAICGGSAIAAVAPAINADDSKTSVALATVFVLNAIALFIFPVIGHYLELSQHQFGLWAAIAIHDTSSVVGAAGAYGDEALAVATTVKLARALWIIPVAMLSALWFQRKGATTKVPTFILLYVAAMIFAWAVPMAEPFYQLIFQGSKRLMVLCLFLIGAGITLKKLQQAGRQPLLLGISLWLLVSTTSLAYLWF